MKRLLLSFVFLLMGLNVFATTYYVRPDGNDSNAGTNDTSAGAWRHIDRGQPTWLREPCRAGDTTIQVVKTSQFPSSGELRIGTNTFSYTGKTMQSFTGCKGVSNVRAESLIFCSDREPAGTGDTVIVKPGVYTLQYEEQPQLLPNIGLAVVMIAKGGTAEAPLVIRGEGFPVVDAKSENKVRSFLIRGNYVHVDGFDIRRGGFWSGWTSGGKILNCRIHEGSYSLSFAYAHDLEIAFNKIYDFQGAWTVHGVTLNQCKDASIHNNTIVSNERGITINGGNNIDIGNNLIAWCRLGIMLGKGRKPEKYNIHDNNLWWIRGGIWLQRDDNNKTEFSYLNCMQGTNDVSVEPMIVNWNPAKPDFLNYHPDSPAIKNGKILFGAGKASKGYPDAGNRSKKNLIFNPSFEAGLLGWDLSSWNGFLPGQAGWAITNVLEKKDEHCLAVYEFPKLKGKGKRINVRICSTHFRYTRGRPLTISFKARAELDKTNLGVGFTVPSWQNKSGTGTHIKLTSEWQTYHYTQTLSTRFPDYAAVTFTTYEGRYWIDDVKVEEGSNATPFSSMLEFVPDWQPGMLVTPGQPLMGRVINRTKQPLSGRLVGTLNAPLRNLAQRVECSFTVDADGSVLVSIKLPADLTGIFLLNYAFEVAGKKNDSAQLRFSIGDVPLPGRNHDFFAATPPYSYLLAEGDLLNKQMNSLASLGLGTLHLYMGYKRINEILASSKGIDIVNAARKVGLEWLFTPSDAAALTGKATWAPGPGNVGPQAIDFKRPELAEGRCTKVQIKSWVDAVGMLAEKMKGRVKYYEILNEPNCFLDGSEYTNVLVRMARVIRDVDSSARILAGSVVNAVGKDLWNKTMTVPVGTFDYFCYHPYRFGLRNPERENMSYRANLLRAKEDLSAHGQSTAVWLTEEGMGATFNETRCIGILQSHSTNIRRQDWGEGEIRQAQYAARMYVTALGEGCAGYNYHTLNGLIRDSLMSPMLALKAIHTMALVLEDAEPLGQFDIGYDYICYLFKSGQNNITAVIWAKDAEYAKPIQITVSETKNLRVVDMFGYKTEQSLAETGTAFFIGRELEYLIFKDENINNVQESLKHAFKGKYSLMGQ